MPDCVHAGSPADAITVVVVDPYEGPRSALVAVLGSARDIDVLGALDSLGQALEAVRRQRPDVVLVDLAALGSERREGLARLCAARRSTAVLVIGMVEDPALDREVQRQGAVGRVLKDAPDAGLEKAIRAAARRATLRVVPPAR